MPNQTLSELLDAATFYSLSVVRTTEGYESSMQTERGNSFRTGFGATAAEAVLELVSPAAPKGVILLIPPPPY